MVGTMAVGLRQLPLNEIIVKSRIKFKASYFTGLRTAQFN